MDSVRRRRGGSFHESFDDNDDDDDNHRGRGNISKPPTKTQVMMDITTPYFDDMGPPMPVDLSKLDGAGDNESDDQIDEDEEDEEMYQRGRSRSRSMIGDESSFNPSRGIPPEGQNGNVDSNIQVPAVSETKSPEKVERTGPLHNREVLALKKVGALLYRNRDIYIYEQGLEQATPYRNKEEVLEEELEKKDAEAEKKLRISSSGSGSSPLISDTITRRVKLLLLGDSGVGKSALIHRWTLDTFSPTLVGTVGVNFKSKRVNVNGEMIQVQVWDTAGQEHFHKITTSYYRGANAIMLVYDVSDEKSLTNVVYWMKNIKSHASEGVHISLVGNKTDLRSEPESSCVDYERGLEVAQKFGIPYFETSAKESYNVDEAFMTSVRTLVSMDVRTSSPNLRDGRQSSFEKANKKGGGLLRGIIPDTNSKQKSKPIIRSSPLKRSGEDKEKCAIS